ncbi:hypothetical protein [Halobacillus sp. Marseille-P3879]|uniref:hypothetical protein n=1 Tax=Halobacillus sp. Marseille-P3879 TaxID=2045014 RepID=UPI000C7DBECB|nr:hypothetical protein [Halobacillus sp. Marseille-P3879]
MERKEIEQYIIEKYRQDEDQMILVFAQWCINHSLDPVILYTEAYPYQSKNEKLYEAIEKTVSRSESEYIPDESIIEILSIFDNNELAFIVNEYIAQRHTNGNN